jgi:hypothetical protein
MSSEFRPGPQRLCRKAAGDRRRRHQPRRPPLAKMRPGSPAPAMGTGVGKARSETVSKARSETGAKLIKNIRLPGGAPPSVSKMNGAMPDGVAAAVGANGFPLPVMANRLYKLKSAHIGCCAAAHGVPHGAMVVGWPTICCVRSRVEPPVDHDSMAKSRMPNVPFPASAPVTVIDRL